MGFANTTRTTLTSAVTEKLFSGVADHFTLENESNSAVEIYLPQNGGYNMVPVTLKATEYRKFDISTNRLSWSGNGPVVLMEAYTNGGGGGTGETKRNGSYQVPQGQSEFYIEFSTPFTTTLYTVLCNIYNGVDPSPGHRTIIIIERLENKFKVQLSNPVFTDNFYIFWDARAIG